MFRFAFGLGPSAKALSPPPSPGRSMYIFVKADLYELAGSCSLASSSSLGGGGGYFMTPLPVGRPSSSNWPSHDCMEVYCNYGVGE